MFQYAIDRLEALMVNDIASADTRRILSQLLAYQQLTNQHGEAACLNILGLIVCALYEYALAEHPEARDYFEQNLAIRQAIGDRWGEAIALHNLLHFKLKEYEAAKIRFQDSLAISKIIYTLHMVTATSMWLGVTAMEQEDYSGARSHLTEALKIAYENGGFGRVMDTLYRWGELLRREGRAEQAVEYLAFAQHHQATDDRVKEGANEVLAELAVHLPPAVMAAAQARGQSRTLEALVLEILAE